MKKLKDLAMGVSFQVCHSQDTCLSERPHWPLSKRPKKGTEDVIEKVTLIRNDHHDRQDLSAVAEAPVS